MAVPAASASVATAFNGLLERAQESSIARIVAGADQSVHNLIDGAMVPAAALITKNNGFHYNNFGTPVVPLVVSHTQLQVTQMTRDARIIKVERDAVEVIGRTSMLADILGKEALPRFLDVGAVQLRLTFAIPHDTHLDGFTAHSVDHDTLRGTPIPPISFPWKDGQNTPQPITLPEGESEQIAPEPPGLGRTATFNPKVLQAGPSSDSAACASAECYASAVLGTQQHKIFTPRCHSLQGGATAGKDHGLMKEAFQAEADAQAFLADDGEFEAILAHDGFRTVDESDQELTLYELGLNEVDEFFEPPSFEACCAAAAASLDIPGMVPVGEDDDIWENKDNEAELQTDATMRHRLAAATYYALGVNFSDQQLSAAEAKEVDFQKFSDFVSTQRREDYAQLQALKAKAISSEKFRAMRNKFENTNAQPPVTHVPSTGTYLNVDTPTNTNVDAKRGCETKLLNFGKHTASKFSGMMGKLSRKKKPAVLPDTITAVDTQLDVERGHAHTDGLGIRHMQPALYSSPAAAIHFPTDCIKKWVKGAKRDINKAVQIVNQVVRVANPMSAGTLVIIDLMVPTEVYTTSCDVCTSIIGDDKLAKNLHVLKVCRKARRVVSQKMDHPHYHYLQGAATLVACASLLSVGNRGKAHAKVLGYHGEQPVFVDYFAETQLEAAFEDLENAKIDAEHSSGHVIWATPAPEDPGGLDPTMVMYETEALKDFELVPMTAPIGGLRTGTDLVGKPPFNDPRHPLTGLSATSRHWANSKTTVGEGTVDEFVIILDHSKKAKMSDMHKRVFQDYIQRLCDKFREFLTNKEANLDFDFLADGRPKSYTIDANEGWLVEAMQDEAFFSSDTTLNELLSRNKATAEHMSRFRDNRAKQAARRQKRLPHKQINQLDAKANCKGFEDADRGRYVMTPGQNGREGLHQARVSPLIKAVDACLAALFNHINVKGMTEETKRIKFAELLFACPKGAPFGGTDCSRNDACFGEELWGCCVQLVSDLNNVFEEELYVRGYMYSLDENEADDAFPSGTINLMGFWTLRMGPVLAMLLSGIGPTGFINKAETDVKIGTTVLAVFGEGPYKKWMINRESPVMSMHPRWDMFPAPHCSLFVDWRPLKHKIVTDTNIECKALKDEEILAPYGGLNEGDDACGIIVPPATPEWDIPPEEQLIKWAAIESKVTNFIVKPALLSDSCFMYGRNAVVNFCSAWFGLPYGKCVNRMATERDTAVMVPMILKALRKIPNTPINNDHRIKLDVHGKPMDVEIDSNYCATALVRYYAQTMYNKESLGTRHIILQHGDYWYRRLCSLVGENKAYDHKTVYGNRDQEKRGHEEVADTTFSYCGEMRAAVHEAVFVTHHDQERVVRVNLAAWRTELKALAKLPMETVQAALIEFDNVAAVISIEDENLLDPMTYWEQLDIGCLLAPLLQFATDNVKKVTKHYRSARVQADAEEVLRVTRESTKLLGQPKHGSGQATGADDKPKGKGGGKGKSRPGPRPAPETVPRDHSTSSIAGLNLEPFKPVPAARSAPKAKAKPKQQATAPAAPLKAQLSEPHKAKWAVELEARRALDRAHGPDTRSKGTVAQKRHVIENKKAVNPKGTSSKSVWQAKPSGSASSAA